MSGAAFRFHHKSWWKGELPSEAKYRTARNVPEKHNRQVDCIITHCCPTSIQNELPDFLEEVRQQVRFKY